MKKSRLARLNSMARSFKSKGTTRKGKSQNRGRRVGGLETLEDRSLMAGDLSGAVFNDTNANGLKDTTENGLAGWTVFVDTNHDGHLNAGEPNAVTDVKGKYTIVGLPAVASTVYEVPQTGFAPTPGFTDHQSITIRDNRAVKLDFPNVTAAVTTGSIAGTVFEDNNENGTKDPGEHGLTGWTLFVDANGDGSLTAGEPTATADADGDYLLANVTAGSAALYEIPQGGLLPTVGGLFPLDGAVDHHQVNVTAGGTVRSDFANLTPQVGTIQGNVWNDANGDGLHGAGEAGLANRPVYIDLDGNGVQDPTDPARVTDANGAYSFANIHTGNYRVKEVVSPGMISADNRSAVVNSTVFRGSLNTIDFFNLTPTTGSISGSLWNDLDGNGAQIAGESGLAGWQVFVDLNVNGSLDGGEPTATTDAGGAYSFGGLPYGNATIREIVPADWISTNPVAGGSTIHLLNGENRTGLNFGNREKIGTIQGTVWNDANGDRLRSAPEAGLADWTVFLDLNSDGVRDATEPAAQTDASGSYSFTRVPIGAYRVVEALPAGWITSEGKTSAINTTLAIGGVNVADFYNLTPAPGSISGVVWSDMDSDGTMAAPESGLEGWQVYVDVNANGLLDASDPQATTDAAGNYTITGVPYGTTTIREVVQAGFTPTNHPGGAIATMVLNGENRVGVNFGNHEPQDYVISGAAFHDLNKDGVRDVGDVGISGVTVYLDTNDNGVLDPSEPTTVTSADLFYTPAVNEIGTYSFTHLARGTYHVREIVPAALEGTPAAARETVQTVGPASQLNADFANVYRANEIHGVVFDDTNANQSRDPQEYARPGVSVYIDLNRDDIYEAGEPQTVTGADGAYAFVGLTPGAYIVREDHGVVGPHTYPGTGGGTLWPDGTSHAAVGNVTPTSITTALADGESYTQTVSLTLPGSGSLTNLVDVFLLFDDTGSFTANSPIVRAAFPTIIDTLQASLPGIDLGFGVGRFEEYANFAAEFATGRPFILNQPIVASSTPGSSAAIQAALDRMAPGYGGDGPETDIEALYQLVTGRGFDGNNNGTVLDSGAAGLAATQVNPGPSGDVPDFASFTADAANGVLPATGNVGGGGFRAGALPIVLLATDIGFAYQPKGETSITGTGGVTLPLSSLTQVSRPTTPFGAGAGIQETVTGVNALGALVIGLGTNAQATVDPRQDLEALSQLTGAVNRSTSTIANGTLDPIAPGDPLYFQISSGFGTTVADGVVNAIQNAVTNVAMDITVRASDPRVHIINHSGTLLGVGAGQSASFDIEFVGDGRPHRFDLEFVREGTSVVLGSIPVVLGTPVVGEGYQYEELADGEIHQSSHFGNYVANVAPSFVGGADVSLLEDAGAQSIPAWATSILAGPLSESGQALDFSASNDNPALFSSQPTIAADGTLTFTPAPNAYGSALVTVSLHDNGGAGPGGVDTSGSQTFLISIAAVDDAPVAADDSYSTSTRTLLANPTGGVLGNDFDADGDRLSAKLVSAPTHGVLTLALDGSFVYTPDLSFSGADSFAYVASDGSLESNVATVTITVVSSNVAPVAADDAYVTAEDTNLTSLLPGVLSNDSDADGDSLSVALVSGPAHGTLTLNANGSFDYAPALNFQGTDSFTYQASDGSLNSNVATVTLTVTGVNDAPVANNDSYGATEDTPLNVVVPGVRNNDSDVDGDALNVVAVTGPAHGTLALSADGSFLYTPNPNFNGADSFTYLVNDGSLNSNVATVTIAVAAVNDAPVAIGNTYSATEDTLLNAAVPGVLNNDTDVDGNPLTAIRVSGPSHGTLTLSANGSFLYTPALNFNGSDSFTYKANDGLADSNVATVTISVAAVNDAPVATGDSYSTNQNAALSIAPRGVLLNDTDADGDSLSAALASGPAHGTLALNADGSFTYTPALNYSGADSFTYRASDAVATSGLATVSVTVVPFVPPTKFFVADADRSATFQYAADGSSLANRALNKSDSKPRGIASNSTGTVQWVVDGSGSVFVYDNLGSLLGQWAPQNVGKPEGIAVKGNDLWVVDPTQDRVYFFAGGATLRTGKVNATSSFALNSGNLNATDLTSDGTHLWVVNDTAASDKVFRYTTSGVLEGSWTISSTNPSPTGITLDPNNLNHLWIVDASTDRVYQYDAATTRLTGSQEPSLTFALASTNTNPQGIADPMPTPVSISAGSVAAAKSVVAGSESSAARVSLDLTSVDSIMAGLADDSHHHDGSQHEIEHLVQTERHGQHELHRQSSVAFASEKSIDRVAMDDSVIADIVARSTKDTSGSDAVERVFADILESGRLRQYRRLVSGGKYFNFE